MDFNDREETRYDVKEEQFCHRSCFRIISEGRLLMRVAEGEEVDDFFMERDLEVEEASTLVEPKFH